MSALPTAPDSFRAVLWRFGGRVQGVGFRPSAYRLARSLGLSGSVRNTPDGAEIVLAGSAAAVDAFLRDFVATLPAAAQPQPFPPEPLPPDAPPPPSPFVILPSAPAPDSRPAPILPDLATCPDCLRELRDPINRRYRYPFITCSHCGPRASIITGLPYDRPATTMAGFPLCPRCAAEYADPADRRFHAQPIACPDCGPHLEFRLSPRDGRDERVPPSLRASLEESGRAVGASLPENRHFRPILGLSGRDVSTERPQTDATSASLPDDAAFAQAVDYLRAGRILALKGIGGFHLLALATSDAAIARLRALKHRPEKPLAVLFPSLDAIRAYARVSDAEAAWLTSPAAPIVLLRRHSAPPPPPWPALSPRLAPHLLTIGAFLPYSPLHWLLLDALRLPVAATSANLADEPLVTDNDDALVRLAPLADAFLLHNRPIAAPYDDSVLFVDHDGLPVFLRRARGLAPYSLPAPPGFPAGIFAAGPATKSAVALSLSDRTISVSPHIGDLSTPRALARWHATADDLSRLHHTPLTGIVADLHPDYPSTRAARDLAAERQIPVRTVQHHVAHVLAAAVEHQIDGPLLGFALDGTGLAPDLASIWGFQAILLRSPSDWSLVASLRPFPLPGADAAARRPLQSAYALCHACQVSFPDGIPLPPATRALLDSLLAATPSPLAPLCSSAGRLFDAVAAFLGLSYSTSSEAIPAMLLQTTAELAYDELQTAHAPLPPPYPFTLLPDGTINPIPLISEIAKISQSLPKNHALADLPPHILPPPAVRLPALRFHLTIAHMIRDVARRHPDLPVALVGGCFQNPLLLRLTTDLLRADSRTVLSLHVLPPSDASLAPASLRAFQ